MATLAQWVGADDRDRLEAVAIDFAADRLAARGTSRARDYVVSWSLATGPRWVTELLEATVYGDRWCRRLRLARSSEGRWSSEVEESGNPDATLAPAGIVDPDSLAGALDCDIALCPMTNTMPILRLGLLEASVPETHLVMAWVDLPSLQVIRSDQLYSSPQPGMVSYESFSRDFRGDLTVDTAGVVIDYPGLATRLPR